MCYNYQGLQGTRDYQGLQGTRDYQGLQGTRDYKGLGTIMIHPTKQREGTTDVYRHYITK